MITCNLSNMKHHLTEIYLYQNVSSSYFNIDSDRLKEECSSTYSYSADRVTETMGRKSVGRRKEEYKLTKVIELIFLSISMSESVTLIQFLTEQNAHVLERRIKQ